MQPDLVTYRRSQEITGRHTTFLTVVAAHGVHRLIATAIDRLTVDIEIVATDAMEGWRCPRVGTRMSDGRDCRHIVDQTVVTRIALFDHPAETVFLEPVVIPCQIVPTHLIHHDSHHEFGSLVKTCVCHHIHCSTQQPYQCNYLFLHIFRSMISKHIRLL